MKKIPIFIVTIMLTLLCISVAQAANYENVTIKKSRSYELADFIDLFATLPEYNTEQDFISIADAKKFTYLVKVPDIPQNKHYYNRFGGMVGLLFNGNYANITEKYLDDDVVKERQVSAPLVVNATFNCLSSEGYNSLTLDMHLPINKIGEIMYESVPESTIDLIGKYFRDNNMKAQLIDAEADKYFNPKYMFKITTYKNHTVYMILSAVNSSSGANGETSIELFFNYKSAKAKIGKNY